LPDAIVIVAKVGATGMSRAAARISRCSSRLPVRDWTSNTSATEDASTRAAYPHSVFQLRKLDLIQ
jgi:hypothetical protein